MKRILGLDLGTTSVGWAVVDQAENDKEKSQIIKLGVRIVPLDTQEKDDFEKGKSITTTADRNKKHGMRINLQRYKQRRAHLVQLLKREGFIADESLLYEDGNNTTFETYRLRAKAATDEITLEQLARVLLMINKKRGYKSNRKVDKKEEGQLIDGMSIARKLYDDHLTPGQFVYQTLQGGNRYIPTFYQSDLRAEFNAIWDYQAQFYPDILDDELKSKIHGFANKDNIPKEIKREADELRKVLYDYNILLADIDLETDLYRSPLQNSLKEYYGSDNEKDVVKQMKDKKAINMYDYLKENKNNLKQLADNKISDPLKIAKKHVEEQYGAY